MTIKRVAPDVVLDVDEFHRKYRIEYDGLPRALPEDLLNFRHKFLREELVEYTMHSRLALEAAEAGNPEQVTIHLDEALDALVDIVYVAVGTAHFHGFDWDEAWRRVHQANMLKVRVAREEDSKRGSKYDVVKPTDWVPPCHLDLVHNHIHQGDHRGNSTVRSEQDTARPDVAEAAGRVESPT